MKAKKKYGWWLTADQAMHESFLTWAGRDMPPEYYKEYKEAKPWEREELEAKQGFYAGWKAAMQRRGLGK